MPYETKIFVDHPQNPNVKISLKELADILKIDEKAMRTRYYNFTHGKMTKEGFYKPRKPKKKQARKTTVYKRIVPDQNNSFVFRPSVVIHDEIVAYAAYRPSDLVNSVLSDIVQTRDGWVWNCYDIGEFPTRNSLVNHYLKLVESGRLYDVAI